MYLRMPNEKLPAKQLEVKYGSGDREVLLELVV